MNRVNVNFSENQIKRLLKGHTVQVSGNDLQKTSFPILITDKQLSTYKLSIKLGKGMRLKISPELMNENHMILGGSVKSFFKGVKKTVKDVSKKVYKDAIKPLKNDLKASLKSGVKTFAMDALASDNIRDYVKDNSKRRAIEWVKDDALNHVRAGVTNSIVIGERELENALINNHGFNEDIAREIISAGSHRLSQKVYDELMGVDEALKEIAVGAGLKRGRDYTIKGGRLSFKGFLKKVNNGFQKARPILKQILQKGAPVLKPLLKIGLQTAIAPYAGPLGSKIAGDLSGNLYDSVQGMGMRKRKTVGGSVKGSAEAKERMKCVRAAKKSSGGALVNSGYGYRGRGRITASGLTPAGYY